MPHKTPAGLAAATVHGRSLHRARRRPPTGHTRHRLVRTVTLATDTDGVHLLVADSSTACTWKDAAVLADGREAAANAKIAKALEWEGQCGLSGGSARYASSGR